MGNKRKERRERVAQLEAETEYPPAPHTRPHNLVSLDTMALHMSEGNYALYRDQSGKLHTILSEQGTLNDLDAKHGLSVWFDGADEVWRYRTLYAPGLEIKIMAEYGLTWSSTVEQVMRALEQQMQP